MFRISPDGVITVIYTDKLQPLFDHGKTVIQRASHVEPAHGKWFADMSPVNGPILGPFTLRQEALDAEVAWINKNIIGD